MNSGRADFVPIFLSEIPHLFRRKILNLDVALIQVSSPDNHGFCTLGPSVDCTRAAIQNAKFIIGKFVNGSNSLLFVSMSTNWYLLHCPWQRSLCLIVIMSICNVALVNPNMPRTFGDGVIHMSHCDYMVQSSDPLPELPIKQSTDEEEKIGKFIAENLVQDGATLQMGNLFNFRYVYVNVRV